jgi:DNA invertase Pin-like site-specific DNA recombinase
LKLPDISPFPAGASIWVYLRDSGGGGQDRSVDQQVDVAKAYCAKFQLNLEEMFADRAREGSSAENRDELTRMLSLLRDRYKPIHDRKRREAATARIQLGILVWSYSRLGRDSLEAGFIKKDLQMRGLLVKSIADDINTGSPLTDQLLEAFYEFTNQMFVDNLSKDVRRGIHSVVSMRDNNPGYLEHNPDHQPTGKYLGIFPGRIAPRGFVFEQIRIGTRRDGRIRVVQRLIPDEALWSRVILAWRMRVEERASIPQIHEVTHLYKEEGGYHNFFRNRIYTGQFAYGGEIYGTPADPFVRPAIPLEWYEKEAQYRELRWERRKPGGSAQAGDIDARIQSRGRLLSGLLVCARCGSTMHATTEQDRIRSDTGKPREGWSHYRCSAAHDRQCDANRVGARRIEGAVVDKLKQDILTPTRLRIILDRLSDHLSSRRRSILKELDALNSAHTEARKRAGGLADALALRPASEMLLQRLDAAELNVRQLNRAIQTIQTEMAYLSAFELDDQELEHIASRMIDALESGDVTRARIAISTFVRKIEVEPDKLIHLKIHWTFPHPDSLDAAVPTAIPLRPGETQVRRRNKNQYPSDKKAKAQKD